ncbi:hypothetical protein [Pedobacter gandavensis]|uniref:Uncharacterized protein n=1 Tax=Pedobacter gandavensis TaxID=2679963 RepID=A0ABR6EV77_9SPHI|nr:hypothetical protein [Pedobacter gandavensis]MBB2149178.1 hypothetical protein [Pedobacter gandavensis]
MKNIRIEIEINKKLNVTELQLPECWDEVPSEVYPQLCSLYLKTAEQMSIFDKTVRAFILLTLPHYETIKSLTGEELYDLLPLVDWVFNKLDLSKNPLGIIRVAGLEFHGPEAEMENLRFAEWCVADTHFINYSRSANINDLEMLAACIYRPVGVGSDYLITSPTYRGDIREKFNDQLLPIRKKLMSTLDPALLHGIYLFFASSKHKIIGLYQEFFPPPKQTSQSTPVDDHSFSWFDIYDDLRGDPKFGGPDKLEDEFLHTVLASIERSKKTMKDLKSKYKI